MVLRRCLLADEEGFLRSVLSLRRNENEYREFVDTFTRRLLIDLQRHKPITLRSIKQTNISLINNMLMNKILKVRRQCPPLISNP